jgi:hypothetical protein
MLRFESVSAPSGPPPSELSALVAVAPPAPVVAALVLVTLSVVVALVAVAMSPPLTAVLPSEPWVTAGVVVATASELAMPFVAALVNAPAVAPSCASVSLPAPPQLVVTTRHAAPKQARIVPEATRGSSHDNMLPIFVGFWSK